jgi:hypothetical protein
MGFGVQVMSDPTAELMDSMEELSFQFEEDEEMEPLTLEELRAMLVDMKAKLDSYSWLQRLFLYEIKPGQVNTLRDTGLNDVTVLDEEHSPALFEMAQVIEDAEDVEDAGDAK